MLTVRIKQPYRHRRGAMTGHDLDEFAGIEVPFDIVGEDLDKPDSCKAAGGENLPVDLPPPQSY